VEYHKGQLRGIEGYANFQRGIETVFDFGREGVVLIRVDQGEKKKEVA